MYRLNISASARQPRDCRHRPSRPRSGEPVGIGDHAVAARQRNCRLHAADPSASAALRRPAVLPAGDPGPSRLTEGRPFSMSAFACRLLRLLPAGSRSTTRPALGSGAAPGDGWSCLELADGLPLHTARELVVRRPDALSLEVLAAAPALLAVVLPEHSRLPAPITAELARRQIATVWRRLPPVPGGPARRSSRPRGRCSMSRRGNRS